MHVLLFVDIDDTLMQTAAKCPTGQPVVPAGLDRAGRAISFMTARQRAFFALLAGGGEVVPTTGRNLAALGRVDLELRSYRIANHGATIVDADGAPVRAWADRVYPLLAARRSQLEQLTAGLLDLCQRAHPRVHVRLMVEHDVPTYVSLKGEQVEHATALLRDPAVQESLSGAGLEQHVLGRNVALLPPETRKRAAVEFVIGQVREQRGADLLTIGVGDSAHDVPYISACDYGIVPGRSQAMELLLEQVARNAR